MTHGKRVPHKTTGHKKTRTCRYCGGTKHDIRTCERFKSDRGATRPTGFKATALEFWNSSQCETRKTMSQIAPHLSVAVRDAVLVDLNTFNNDTAQQPLQLLAQIRNIADGVLVARSGSGYRFFAGEAMFDSDPEPVRAWKLVLKKASKETGKLEILNTFDNFGPPTGFQYIAWRRFADNVARQKFTPLKKCLCQTVCGDSCSCRETRGLPESTTRECHEDCNCNSNCGNRTVQNGRTVDLQIFRTAGTGWGVRSLESIPVHTFVSEYVGMVITKNDSNAISESTRSTEVEKSYFFDLDYNGRDDVQHVIDSFQFGNVTRFLNHSCRPNLYVKVVFTRTNVLGRIVFYSLTDIPAGAELTFDYAGMTKVPGYDSDSDDSSEFQNASRFEKCLCGSSNCRGNIWG